MHEFLITFLLIIQISQNNINCLNITNFTIENGSITYKRPKNNENVYEVKCGAGYTLNSNTSVIVFDFQINKWRPINGHYFIQTLPLCSKICKIKLNGFISFEENDVQQTYFDSSTQTLVINDNFKTTLKCRENNTIIKSTQSYQQQQQQDARTVECNNELRGLNLIEYKCLNVCNVNYLVNLMRNQENIGKFYPINPLNQYYLNHEPMRFYCNSVDYDRKVVLFECVNTNWRLATRNEMVTNERQIVNECVYTDDGNDESDDDGTTANSSHFSNIEYYFRKNFKNLLNLKLNLKLFLIILLVSSALIILFLMMLLLITFYKRYRLTNYYRSLFTQRHSSLQVQQQQQRASRRCSSSLLNNLLRSFRRQQNQQSLRRYEDQITFSIGSSSSLNNQNNNNCALATQNLILPSYDEATNKPVQMSEGCQQPAETTTVLHPPSPPPSFSAISKEVSNVVQSCNDNTNTNNNNISNIDDSQSNYSSISAAPALMLNNKRIIKQLKFSSSNSHHYLQNQQSFYDSNETFSLNSGIAIANAIGTSEVCTIVTNDSAESNASKFVLRGSFDNNIDQTSLLNYSTSLSDAILHNEVEPLLTRNNENNQITGHEIIKRNGE